MEKQYYFNRFSLLYRILILLCTGIGLLLHTGIIGGKFTPSLFRMFTVQSNCLVFLYYLFGVAHSLLRHEEKSFAPRLKFIMTVSILLTGLVAAFMLGDMLRDSQGTMRVSLILLHDVVPLLVLLDWLLFDVKGHTTMAMPLLSLSFPLLYCIYIFVSAPFLQPGTVDFGGIAVNYRYPYPFLQIDTYGIGLVILCIVVLALLLVGIGYLGYWFDHLLARRSRHAKSV